MSYQKILHYAREMRKNPTPAESYFWAKVRNRRFLGKKFNRQFIIQHEEVNKNKRFFIADFHCHEKKLIVELDGGIHLNQIEYDRIRENKLQKLGFVITRFTNEIVLEDWKSVSKALEDILNSPQAPLLERKGGV